MTALFRLPSKWNGLPPDPQTSGWHVLGMPQFSHSAETGLMVFLSHWCAHTQCWGTDRDRRRASWAVGQRLTYISRAPDAADRIIIDYQDVP
ncbi:hypothetical protein [Gluconobacter morbifer]|uniref:Uncharacterized protein n=1 Tax=Gluconobacter morbifer G707 TaxID=1088869 RepID=G6XHY7_9PROT|nr:hypothetical protein [Gluconobacter morbifer]EHH68361.1 hypothetical protein GMO_11310 [Gluconobacter morbifer G707]